jgi:hypothetical protein
MYGVAIIRRWREGVSMLPVDFTAWPLGAGRGEVRLFRRTCQYLFPSSHAEDFRLRNGHLRRQHRNPECVLISEYRRHTVRSGKHDLRRYQWRRTDPEYSFYFDAMYKFTTGQVSVVGYL